MNTKAMLRAFCDAVEQRNGKAFAELFTEDGVYHDVFYGAFAGREKIAGMIDDWFYRTATDFRWDMRGQNRRISRGRQHRDRLRRHELRAGADREDRCQAGCGAEGAAGDEAASGVRFAFTSRHSGIRPLAQTRNPLGRINIPRDGFRVRVAHAPE